MFSSNILQKKDETLRSTGVPKNFIHIIEDI